MRNKKIRFVYFILVGIVISMIIHVVSPISNPNHNSFIDLIISVLITVFIWEGNLRLDAWLNKKYSWIEQTGKRLLIQAPLSLLMSTILIIVPMFLYERYICCMPAEQERLLMITCTVIGLLSSVILLSLEIGAKFFREWKNSLVEVEKYKTESAQAQLQNLKEQVNPHFLFNNLSVLSSLVYKDQDKAVDFINQLSKVYRYLLDTRNSELISLGEELTFIESYTFLLQIRFDTNIRFEFDIPNESKKTFLPPMALQMLIENTIKHNEVSSEFPLTVTVKAQAGLLQVQNNLQPRLHREPSSNTGLQNIRERYKHYTNIPVEVTQDARTFVVTIPLLTNNTK